MKSLVDLIEETEQYASNFRIRVETFPGAAGLRLLTAKWDEAGAKRSTSVTCGALRVDDGKKMLVLEALADMSGRARQRRAS